MALRIFVIFRRLVVAAEAALGAPAAFARARSVDRMRPPGPLPTPTDARSRPFSLASFFAAGDAFRAPEEELATEGTEGDATVCSCAFCAFCGCSFCGVGAA